MIDFSIVRPSAVYGPTDMNRRKSNLYRESTKRRKADYTWQKRSPGFYVCKDIANGFVLAATKPEASKQTFNITMEKHTHWSSLQKY